MERLGKAVTSVGIAMLNDLLPNLAATSEAMVKAQAAGEGFWGTMITGLQMFLTGNDRYKNDVKLFEQTETQLALMQRIDKLRSEGRGPGDAQFDSDTKNLKIINDALKTTLAYRKLLEGEAFKAPTAKKSVFGIPDEEGLKKAAAEAERYRKLDAAGWVKYIEAMTEEYEDELKAQAKLNDESIAESERVRQQNLAGEVAMYQTNLPTAF